MDVVQVQAIETVSGFVAFKGQVLKDDQVGRISSSKDTPANGVIVGSSEYDQYSLYNMVLLGSQADSLSDSLVHALEFRVEGGVHLDLLREEVDQLHHFRGGSTVVIHFHHKVSVHKSSLVRFEGQLDAVHLRCIILALSIGGSHTELENLNAAVVLAQQVKEVKLIQPLGISRWEVSAAGLGSGRKGNGVKDGW